MTKPVLGKGIEAVLGGSKTAINNMTRSGVSEINIATISANPDQPRKTFNDESLQELADSIKELGVITPITVRKTGVNAYQIISGERRFRASKLAQKETIPAYVRDEVDDQKTLIMGLVENIQREDLDPIEIAITYQRLIEEGNLTQEQLGQKVGKSNTTIANSIRLLKLPPEIQVGLANGDISEGHAKVILSVSDEHKQKELYTEIIDKGLSVRALEELVHKIKEQKDSAKSASSKLNAEQKTLQEKIATKLNSKVSLSVTPKGNGKISIPFNNTDELNKIVALLDQIK